MNVSRPRRSVLWGVVSVLLAAAVFVSYSFAKGAIGKARAEAQQRAKRYANTVLFKSLTPGVVSRPITGHDYGEVLIDVQTGILSDDRVARVRVWNDSGTLVFSTDQRDRLGEDAHIEGVIKQVLGGTTISDVVGNEASPDPGPAAPSERLLVTYTPLQLGDQASFAAVAEIDQKYASIESAARAPWSVVIALAVVLLASLTLLGLSLRGARGSGRPGTLSGDLRANDRLRALERQVRELERKARNADERAGAIEKDKASLEQEKALLQEQNTELELQLATHERNLRDVTAAARSKDEDAAALAARVPELEREVAELRARVAAAQPAPVASLEEVEAAGQLAQTHAALRDATDRITVLQSEVERAERARAEAVAELQRASVAYSEREQQIRQLQTAVAERDQLLEQLRQALTQRDAEREQLRAGLNRGMSELEQLRAEAVARNSELESLRTSSAAAASELDQLREHAGVTAAELDTLRAGIASKAAELDSLRIEVTTKDAEVVQLRGSISERDVELRRLRSELEQANNRLEQVGQEGAAAGTPLAVDRVAPAGSGVEAELGGDLLSLRERLARATARRRVHAPGHEEHETSHHGSV